MLFLKENKRKLKSIGNRTENQKNKISHKSIKVKFSSEINHNQWGNVCLCFYSSSTLHSKLPQTYWLQTALTYYLTVSEGLSSGQG